MYIKYPDIDTKLSKVLKNVGNYLKQEFEKTGVYEHQKKGLGDIVTQADKNAEEMIVTAINRYWPKHSILAEEGGQEDKDSEYLWVIDPIDGTTNFTMKNPFFNTSVALFKDGKPLFGMVYAPLFDEMYSAFRGEGAKLNNHVLQIAKETKDEKISLDQQFHGFCYGKGLKNSKMLAADYYKWTLEHGFKARQLGAAALELARVANSLLGSMIVPGANPWDVGAGALIIEEAGGIVTDLNGKPYNLNSKTGIIASNNQHSHQEILKYVKKNWELTRKI